MSEVVATQPHQSSRERDGSHANKAEHRGSAGLGMRSEERVKDDSQDSLSGKSKKSHFLQEGPILG